MISNYNNTTRVNSTRVGSSRVHSSKKNLTIMSLKTQKDISWSH